ncbi:hypothetical protein CCYN49044_200081 [Capnocytophaga cynodegmi]|uniref:Uncharacterized protein n=1 Tax=Capnocytophaga cynodegmi TaxID=28189 RepID=A0A0B7HF78_9FLAO|nr:hypothetical protein CCYN74_100081 [Capnocytophaga cynodegmi]CEN37900.1 hypothetical protein CCYN49044_200081 [Capnocytophaga cynodegmi]
MLDFIFLLFLSFSFKIKKLPKVLYLAFWRTKNVKKFVYLIFKLYLATFEILSTQLCKTK